MSDDGSKADVVATEVEGKVASGTPPSSGAGDGAGAGSSTGKAGADDENTSNGLCIRRPYGFKKSFGKVEIREYADIDVDGAVLIDGFPAGSVTAVIAAGYLADHLKLPVVAEFTSINFPSVCVVERAQPLNAMRMVGNRDVIVLLSEFKVVDPELTQDIVEAVFDFAERHRITNMFTVEGVPKEVVAKVLEERKKEAKEKEAKAKKAAEEAKQKADADAAAVAHKGATEDAADTAEGSGKGVKGDEAGTKAGEGGDSKPETKAGDKSKEPGSSDGGKEGEEEKPKPKPKKKKRVVRRSRSPGMRRPGAPEDPTAHMTEEELTALMSTLMFLTTHKETADKLAAMGHVPVRNAGINGTTGRFLANINRTAVEVTCLLAPTHSRLPDALSGVAIVQCLDTLLTHIDIDLGPLKTKANSLEESISQLRSMMAAQKKPRAVPQGLYS